MGSATGFTAARMLQIEQSTVTDGFIDLDGRLILERRDGQQIVAGDARGPQGIPGNNGTNGENYRFTAGIIELFGGSVPPAGWMICNGASLLRSQYPELFAAIGTTYGSINASEFNIPDMRGRAPVGLDPSQTEFNNLGKTGGAKTHTLTIDEMPSHAHAWNAAGNNNIAAVPGNWDDLASGNSNALGAGPANPESGNGILPRGGGQPHNNLQPYGVFNYIISLGQSATVGGGSPIEAQYIGRGTTGERDAIFGVPGTDPQRVALANAKRLWFNTDFGWFETYYAIHGTSGLTARGLLTGGGSAGWYPIPDNNTPRIHLAALNSQQSSTNGTEFQNWDPFMSTAAPAALPAVAGSLTTSWRIGGETWFGWPSVLSFVEIKQFAFYDVSAAMNFPVGGGTGVMALRVYRPSNGNTPLDFQKAVPLNGSYGSYEQWDLPNLFLRPGDRVYFQTVAASWGIGGDNTFLDIRYAAPPLVSQ